MAFFSGIGRSAQSESDVPPGGYTPETDGKKDPVRVALFFLGKTNKSVNPRR
jgi:hypothetical protein